VYGAVPELTLTPLIEPVSKPQNAVSIVRVEISTAGLGLTVTTMEAGAELQPKEFVFTTEYVPEVFTVMLAFVEPLLHKFPVG
jgi:hypothetical protein